MMPLRQSWGESQPLRRDTGFCPYREMRMWRRRFWWSLAINAVLLVAWLRSCR